MAEGVFLSGSLYLKSDVTLEVTASAVLKASGDIGDYGDDTHCNRYRNEAENIRLYNSAAWTTAFLDSSYIWIRGVEIRNEKQYNGDGLDLDGCSHVFVSGCAVSGISGLEPDGLSGLQECKKSAAGGLDASQNISR